MIAAMLVSMVESIGDYYAAAQLAGAPPPSGPVISRGLAGEGRVSASAEWRNSQQNVACSSGKPASPQAASMAASACGTGSRTCHGRVLSRRRARWPRARVKVGRRVEAGQVVWIVLEAARGHVDASLVRAAQQTRRERVECDEGAAVLAQQRQQLQLNRAVERVVQPLVHARLGQPVLGAQRKGARNLGRVVVRHADGAHPPLQHHRVRLAQRLEERRLRVGLVKVVLCQRLHADRSQRRVELLPHARRCAVSYTHLTLPTTPYV